MFREAHHTRTRWEGPRALLTVINTVMCSLGGVFAVRSVTPVHCLILLNPNRR